ncbi:MAG: hypothetical protein IIZ12_05970 [Eggerthellaceae bacterium]|nr:hypothetical protein [Eggerthellaceae bacterium]
MGELVKRYRDAYGQCATAIKNTYDNGWKLTFRRRGESYTRNCRSEQDIRRILDANGHSWTEVG